MQAYLEHEPHLRGHKEEYIRRYQQLALQELQQALKGWDDHERHGGECKTCSDCGTSANGLLMHRVHALACRHKAVTIVSSCEASVRMGSFESLFMCAWAWLQGGRASCCTYVCMLNLRAIRQFARMTSNGPCSCRLILHMTDCALVGRIFDTPRCNDYGAQSDCSEMCTQSNWPSVSVLIKACGDSFASGGLHACIGARQLLLL